VSHSHLMPSRWAGALALLSILGVSLALASAEDTKAKPPEPSRQAPAKKAVGDDERTDETKAKDPKAPATQAQPGFNTIEEIVALDSSLLLREAPPAPASEVRWLPVAPLNK